MQRRWYSAFPKFVCARLRLKVSDKYQRPLQPPDLHSQSHNTRIPIPPQDYSLIPPSPLLPVHPAKSRNPNLHLHRSHIVHPSTSSSSRPSPFRGPRNGTDYFRVAHFQVRAPVRSSLGGDLGRYAPQLVPAPTVKAEKREGVG